MLPYSPAVEAKLTIEPLPRAIIAGSTARQATNAVVAFAREHLPRGRRRRDLARTASAAQRPAHVTGRRPRRARSRTRSWNAAKRSSSVAVERLRDDGRAVRSRSSGARAPSAARSVGRRARRRRRARARRGGRCRRLRRSGSRCGPRAAARPSALGVASRKNCERVSSNCSASIAHHRLGVVAGERLEDRLVRGHDAAVVRGRVLASRGGGCRS